MALCNLMPDTYVLTQSAGGNGQYVSGNAPTDDYYSYYLHPAAHNDLHFTLGRTGNGLADQSAMALMHITQTLPGTGFNIRRYFDMQGNVTGYNISQVPLGNQAAARTLMHASYAMYQRMAQEIINLLD